MKHFMKYVHCFVVVAGCLLYNVRSSIKVFEKTEIWIVLKNILDK